MRFRRRSSNSLATSRSMGRAVSANIYVVSEGSMASKSSSVLAFRMARVRSTLLTPRSMQGVALYSIY